MTSKVLYRGHTYEVDFIETDEGMKHEVFVIKTRWNRTASGTNGNTWRHRITSQRKIKDVMRNGIFEAI